MFDKNERATALLALRSSASSTSSPMYSPECSVSTCAQHKTAITMRPYLSQSHAYTHQYDCNWDTYGRIPRISFS